MEITNWFPTPIGEFNSLTMPSKPNSPFKGAVDVAGLQRYILNIVDEESSVQKSNIGGFQSINDFLNRDNPLSFQLKKFIIAMFLEYSGYLDLRGYDLNIDSWANVNSPGDRNCLHNHPGANFAGAFYIKSPAKSGAFIGYDPRASKVFSDECNSDLFKTYGEQNEYHPDNLYAPNRYYKQPNPGDLVIFPAWMQHEVEPNLSKEPRISVAFNIYLARKWDTEEERDRYYNGPNDIYKNEKKEE